MSQPALDPVALRERSTALAALRLWFGDHGYPEVPTPAIVPSPALEVNLYGIAAGGAWLRTSPEFALKKALATGLGRAYELGPCFRDFELGPWHRREFLMLEWYRAGAVLDDLMDEVEDLFAAVARALHRPAPGPWARRSVRAVFQGATGLDAWTTDADTLVPGAGLSWDDAFFQRWVDEVERTITAPTFLYDWPASQAALAEVRRRPDGDVALRFEVFLSGVELGNAFQELREPDELRRRFAESAAIRLGRGEQPHPVDEDLIDAVGRLPKMAGIAVGFDRMVATITGRMGIGAGRVVDIG